MLPKSGNLDRAFEASLARDDRVVAGREPHKLKPAATIGRRSLNRPAGLRPKFQPDSLKRMAQSVADRTDDSCAGRTCAHFGGGGRGYAKGQD